MSITVAIVEDEKHYNNALKKIIDYDADLLCVGQFYSGKEALEELQRLKPNVVLMDIKLPDISGVEVISLLVDVLEHTNFMICTSFEDDNHIYDALKVGAAGYLIKGESLEKIISSIKEVYRGGAPMSFGVAKKILKYFREEKVEFNNHLNDLSKTEHDILELLAQGLLYKEIADKKEVTIDTIKKHVGNIYRKLHVNNKVEAINILKKN
jgi:DNA-binding NarL/FixJ family response regulator